jgi:hypothetical protein
MSMSRERLAETIATEVAIARKCRVPEGQPCPHCDEVPARLLAIIDDCATIPPGQIAVSRDDVRVAAQHMMVDGEYARAIRERLSAAAGVSQ